MSRSGVAGAWFPRERSMDVAGASAVRTGHGRRLAVIATLALLATTGLAWMVSSGALQAADVAILVAVQRLHFGLFALPLRALNMLGFPPLVDIVYGAIALVIFLSGKRREAVAAAFTTGCSAGLNHIAKALVPRDRPPEELGHAVRHIANSSFPAGHVLNLVAFLGFLCVLLWTGMAPSWRRSALVALLVTIILGMGLARVYAGQHWPSDVLAGYLLGVAAMCAGIAFYQFLERRHHRARDTSVPAGELRES